MNTRIFIAITLLVCGAVRLESAPIQLAFPDSFTPGVPFTFSVGVPAITNLGSYNIDVQMTGSTGAAGTDFFFDLAATDAATSGYVFPVTDFFFAGTNLDSTATERLTLTDFNFVGVNVIPGTTSAIADVTVTTLPGYTGNLTFAIDTDFLILDTPDLTPTPVAEFDTIQTDTIASGPVTILAVPEPSSIAALSLGAFWLVRRSRNRLVSAHLEGRQFRC